MRAPLGSRSGCETSACAQSEAAAGPDEPGPTGAVAFRGGSGHTRATIAVVDCFCALFLVWRWSQPLWRPAHRPYRSNRNSVSARSSHPATSRPNSPASTVSTRPPTTLSPTRSARLRCSGFKERRLRRCLVNSSSLSAAAAPTFRCSDRRPAGKDPQGLIRRGGVWRKGRRRLSGLPHPATEPAR